MSEFELSFEDKLLSKIKDYQRNERCTLDSDERHKPLFLVFVTGVLVGYIINASINKTRAPSSKGKLSYKIYNTIWKNYHN